MKLGEALTLRARNAQKLADLQSRIKAAATVQEGDKPAEDATSLMARYAEVSTEHCRLVVNIQLTNAKTSTDEGTVIELLQLRDHLARLRSINKSTAEQAAGGGGFRWARNEIKIVATVAAKELQEEADKLDERIRQLDAQLQEINWQTDLIEFL